MKILKIQVTGLKLFEKEIEIDFYAKQRVNSEKNEMLTNIFSNIYINNVISLVGINASGKTTTLKLISFALQLLNNEPISNIHSNDILEGIEKDEEIIFNIYFVNNNGILLKLKSVIKTKHSKTDMRIEHKSKYFISKETLWAKPIGSIQSKKDLFTFSNTYIIEERQRNELFLLDDVSIIVAHNKKYNGNLEIIDSIHWRNFSEVRILGDFPISLVQFLDPSIEYLECKYPTDRDKREIQLKFYGKKEIIIRNPLELYMYLSSGTVKGLNVFLSVLLTLQEGGYLIIDELENHFNKEIVSTLIKFFMDSEININGAVLVFSTHYIELLDIFERNDNIYLVKNTGGINIENLSDLLKRNDVKKSDLFQSGYLANTTPSYESYINFKRTLVKLQKEGKR